MRKAGVVAMMTVCVTVCALALRVPIARACGGFFCGRQPVDQTAERILFKVGPNSVTMVVQIAYTGAAADFAWVLPLATVPKVDSLAVFPQRALTALDANTGPQFQLPEACYASGPGFAVPEAAGADEDDHSNGAVTVHFRAEVGPFEAVALESSDPDALYAWLKERGFNVNEPMRPYIRVYTEEGMKFLALKLQQDKQVSDIQPLRFELDGTTPSIPLRMTALAAEPEMSILVFVFGEQRYSGANWPDVEIENSSIVWRANRYPIETNWAALVARGVDQAGGRGWVTELAGSTTELVSSLVNSSFASEEDSKAGMELRALIGNSPYLSRLYTRMSAEEMTDDPVFHRVAGGEVSSVRKLARVVEGVDLCPTKPVSADPCAFASCGAGGICRPVVPDVQAGAAAEPIAGCGCLGGATARTTFDPVSVTLQAGASAAPAATVTCQDLRMSFVNPGDMAESGMPMPDPCVAFDCGSHGKCVAMNMTPTCACDVGYVAVGSFKNDGTRQTTCKAPMIAVPQPFYAQRLPDLPATLPGGREVEVDTDMPVIQPNLSEDPLPGAMSGPSTAQAEDTDSGCRIGALTQRGDQTLLIGLFAVWLATRRRRARARGEHA